MSNHIPTVVLLILAVAPGCGVSSTRDDSARTESTTGIEKDVPKEGVTNKDVTKEDATEKVVDEDPAKLFEARVRDAFKIDGDRAARDPVEKQGLLPAGDRITTEAFSILVPEGWNNLGQLTSSRKKLFLVGDGKGVSAFDDTQSPLQLGMEIEHYPVKETIEDRIKILTADAQTAPQRTLVSEPTIEDVELADGTKGSLMFVEMIKQGVRRSLYIKLLIQDQSGTTWAISAWIVGNKDSMLPKRDSELARRMQSFVQSFAFAGEP